MNKLSTNSIDEHARLRVRDVLKYCAISRATLYKRLQTGNFPQPVRVAGSVRWVAGEIQRHLEREEQQRG